jgi:rhodanese-related sulfurtransferase
MASIPQRLDELPRTQPVVCICHHGVRSAQVVAFLMRHGWTDVYNLAGGIEAWSTQVDARVPRY